MIGVTAQAAVLVHTERGTVTAMPSAPKTMSVETITASTTGIWQKQKLTAAFRVPNHYEKKQRNSFAKLAFDSVDFDSKFQR